MVTLRTGRPCHHVIMGIDNPVLFERCWIAINSEPVKAAGTKPVREAAAVASFSDVTEERQHLAELRLWSVVYA